MSNKNSPSKEDIEEQNPKSQKEGYNKNQRQNNKIENQKNKDKLNAILFF